MEKVKGDACLKVNIGQKLIYVSSKVFFGCHGTANKPNQMGLSRKHVIEACHEALQRLQVDYLDLYFCHFPDINTPVEETVLAMNTLIQQGKILYWGTSQWSGVEIMEAHRIAEKYRLIGPTMEQPEYNLLERQRVEKEFLPIYQNVGLGTTIWSPLASGLLTGKYNEGLPAGSRLALKGYEWVREKYFQEGKLERVRKMTEYAKKIGLAPAVLAIAWCLKNPNVSTAILGATKKEQLKQNLSALDAVDKLTPEVLKELDNIMQNNPLHVKNEDAVQMDVIHHVDGAIETTLNPILFLFQRKLERFCIFFYPCRLATRPVIDCFSYIKKPVSGL